MGESQTLGNLVVSSTESTVRFVELLCEIFAVTIRRISTHWDTFGLYSFLFSPCLDSNVNSVCSHHSPLVPSEGSAILWGVTVGSVFTSGRLFSDLTLGVTGLGHRDTLDLFLSFLTQTRL